MAQRVVLAYSGGLDTSVCIKWLQEKYDAEVIALTADVGEGKDLEAIRQKALQVGAVECRVVDGQDEFAESFVLPALRANAVYEGVYPLSAALSRPYIARLLVETAREVGAGAVAHGCTGKGNDQVRFDVSVGALAPDLKIIAPVREWAMSREEALDYAEEHGIPVPVGRENPYSIDENIWGRSIEAGRLEDPWLPPPAEAFAWTAAPEEAPAQPRELVLAFEAGTPVGLDGQRLSLAPLIQTLNELGGSYGVGRIDHVENRLVGIKSREIYEAPGATLLLTAHRALEDLTLPRETAHLKAPLEQHYGRLVYNGLWFAPLKDALDAFFDELQQAVTGEVRIRLTAGAAQVVGRRSPNSLYDRGLATYDADDTFDHAAAAGFINVWGLPTRVYASVHRPLHAQEPPS